MARTSYICWDDVGVCFVLGQHVELWFLIVLADCNNSLQVDMSLHWYITGILYAFLMENQQIPILWSLVWPNWGSKYTWNKQERYNTTKVCINTLISEL
jgi:hypothetical protein